MSLIVVTPRKTVSAKLPLPVFSQATCQRVRTEEVEDFRGRVLLSKINDFIYVADCDGLCMAGRC
jgi:hypothetical protein